MAASTDQATSFSAPACSYMGLRALMASIVEGATSAEEGTGTPAGQAPAASGWPPMPNMATTTTMRSMRGAAATPATMRAHRGPRRSSPANLRATAFLALAWAAFLAAAATAAGTGTRYLV